MRHKAFLLMAILAAVCGNPPWALAAEAETSPVHPPNVLLLTRAVEAGTQSPSILERLAAIEYTAGDTAASGRHRVEARRLAGR